MSFPIYPLPIFNDNYIWLMIDESNSKAICVDPGEAKSLVEYLKQKKLKLDAIFITHHHIDHIGGIPDLLKHFPQVHIYGPKDEMIPFINHVVKDNDNICLFNEKLQFKILETPGHTKNHICYYADNSFDNPVLFCGDTLFSGGCGRLLGGSMSQLFHSLERLKKLPISTKVYCAHEYTRKNLYFYQNLNTNNRELTNYAQLLKSQSQLLTLPSTIEKELQINPFLRCESQELKQKFYGELSDLSPKSIFSHLRQLKDHF